MAVNKMVYHFFFSMAALRATNIKLSDWLLELVQSVRLWYRAEQNNWYHLREQRKLIQKLVTILLLVVSQKNRQLLSPSYDKDKFPNIVGTFPVVNSS